MEKVTSIAPDPHESCVQVLKAALERTDQAQFTGMVVLGVTEGQLETSFNAELRAESVIALIEVVKRGALDALIAEVMA